LIAFNRPDTTQKVFEKIREARPTKIFVAVDGPREDKPEDNERIKKVREIVQKVDWPCESFYHFNKQNSGAEITVSSAISWVFKNQDCAIILEDDIVAPLSFFRFAEEMLIKYADNSQIGTVTGSNFTP